MDMLSCSSRDLIINAVMMKLEFNAGQRESLILKGELIRKSAIKDRHLRKPHLDINMLPNILELLRNLKVENVPSLSYTPRLSEVEPRTWSSHTQSKSNKSEIFSNIPSGVSHIPSGVSHIPSGVSHIPSGVSNIPSGVSHEPVNDAVMNRLTMQS